MGRAVGPVVAPADDEVAAGGVVAVFAEILALEFKFDEDALPTIRANLADGFAVRKSISSGFYVVAEVFCQHAEEQHDTLFVGGFVSQAVEIHRVAVGGATL